MAPTNLITIKTLLGTIKWTVKLTLPDWKPSKMNHAPTPSNILTAVVIIRQTLTSIFFGNTSSITNGTLKSIMSSMTIGSNWLVQLWTVVSGAVHTGVEVRRMDSEMSGLVEWPWLQLMCCAICLPRSRNFRWMRENPSGSEYWLVCRRWTPEIEFNKRLSSLIIRLVNYSVTTSLIYKLII